MGYQLYRLVDVVDEETGSELLGVYEAFEDALTARDEDTIRIFETTSRGEVMLVRHDIVGPGADGSATCHPVTTAVERKTLGDPAEIADVRGWLSRIHASTGRRS
jgi:hypothetical protein